MTTVKPLVVTGAYPPDIGGSATYADLLIHGLSERGIDPGLLVFSRLLSFPRGMRHALLLRSILETARDFDVIYALDPVSSGLAALLGARLLHRRLLLRVGGDFAWQQATERFGVGVDLDRYQGGQWGWRADLLGLVQRIVACRADLIIVPTEHLGGIVRDWGAHPARVIVVPNGVAPTATGSSYLQARAELGIGGELVVSAGRLVKFKGFEGLIAATAKLQDRYPLLRLAILGDGPQAASLARKSESLGVGSRTDFVGAVSRETAMKYLRAADLFVLNSLGEGQSNAILEAMVCETPVIATRVPGNLEFIEHGQNGWLVEVGDRLGLAVAIDELLVDRDTASRLARGGKRLAARHSVSQMVERTMEVLAALP